MGSIDRHAAAFGAVRTLLATHGLPGNRLDTWKDGSNLLVRPVPVPVILRVATFTGRVRRDPMPYLQREVELVSWLASHGAPVMPPADVMPPGPFRVDGWGIAAWRFLDHRAGVIPNPLETLAALDDLRAVLRGYPGDLPAYGPVTSDLERALAFALEAGILSPGSVDDARRRRDVLLARGW